jgi:hypothetical protein
MARAVNWFEFEMMFLFVMMCQSLQRFMSLCFGMNRPQAQNIRAQAAIKLIAMPCLPRISPRPAPVLRLHL